MMAAAKNDSVNFAEDHISEMLHHVPERCDTISGHLFSAAFFSTLLKSGC